MLRFSRSITSLADGGLDDCILGENHFNELIEFFLF